MTPRERILSAARRIHDRHGLSGLSIRRVSARVGLTPMAVYRHFADKDALLDALVAEGFAEWETYVAKAADAPTPEARIRAVIRGYVAFALDRPRVFELMFLVPRRRVPTAPASLQTTPSPAFSRIIAALHEAMQTGIIANDDPAQVLLFVWSVVHGLVTLHFSGRFGFDDAVLWRMVDQQLDRLMRLLACQPASARR
jgi:AcrR family transcriptional regulator